MSRHRIEALLDCSPDAAADIFAFAFERLVAEDGKVLHWFGGPEPEQKVRPELHAVKGDKGTT